MSLTKPQRARLVSALTLSRRVLLAAILVQALIFLPASLVSPDKLFGFVLISSALLGSFGFVLAYRKLDLTGEADALRFFGPNLRGITLLMFMGTFLVPFLNALIFAWAWLKAGAAIQALAADGAFQSELDARRARLRGG